MDASTCRYTDSEMKGTSAYLPLPHGLEIREYWEPLIPAAWAAHSDNLAQAPARLQHLRTTLLPFNTLHIGLLRVCGPERRRGPRQRAAPVNWGIRFRYRPS